MVALRWALHTLLMTDAVIRPPNQTAVQKQTLDHHAAIAATASEAAKPSLLRELDSPNFRQGISGLTDWKNKSAVELLAILRTEVTLSIASHNTGGGVAGHGVPLETVEKFKYFPTLWDQLAEGTVAWSPGMADANTREVRGLRFPDMAMPPKAPAAYDRSVYTGLNIWKQSAGQVGAAGPVAFVLDHTGMRSLFIAPVDTGTYFLGCGFPAGDDFSRGPRLVQGKMALADGSVRNLTYVCGTWDGKFGTMAHMYHLVMTHVKFWAPTFSLSTLFARWYGAVQIPPGFWSYLEAEYSATFLLPERLLYLCISFDWFGTASGAEMQRYASVDLRRPLVWGNPENKGDLVDASVGNVDGVYRPSAQDRADIKALWATKATWAQAMRNISVGLQLHLLGFQYAARCNTTAFGIGARFLGVNGHRECIYYHPK